MSIVQRPVSVTWPTLPGARAVECAAAVVANSCAASANSWIDSAAHDRSVWVSPVRFGGAMTRAWMAGVAAAVFTAQIYANPFGR